MDKGELANVVATTADIPKALAKKVVDAWIATITDTLKQGGDVILPGFGVFYVKQRAEGTGRDPQTGETIAVAAARVPSFKADKGLKTAMN
ncbi:DNA-binding protein HU-beta [Streptomyces litmocidini]|uniref:HU family DNA-binding protein n=1 Tax=Streptomyces litmocidini TaxID=67318 RepID=UPI00167E0F18|nr:HU family DNA-binding protein [Streptomyces litmocidini]GGU79021.1 DNA-binding protein HU-beta [Streptomyces litmocidini]